MRKLCMRWLTATIPIIEFEIGKGPFLNIKPEFKWHKLSLQHKFKLVEVHQDIVGPSGKVVEHMGHM